MITETIAVIAFFSGWALTRVTAREFGSRPLAILVGTFTSLVAAYELDSHSPAAFFAVGLLVAVVASRAAGAARIV